MRHDRMTGALTHRDIVVQDIEDIILDIFDMYDDAAWSLRELDLLIKELLKDTDAVPTVRGSCN